MRREVLKLKSGEYAIKLEVTRPVKCSECHRELGRGENFWLDFVPFRTPTQGKTHFKKVVCLACWRGPHNTWEAS